MAVCNGRERVPLKWTPLIDRTRLKIGELERVRIEKAKQLLRDMRLNCKTCGRNYWLDHDCFRGIALGLTLFCSAERSYPKTLQLF